MGMTRVAAPPLNQIEESIPNADAFWSNVLIGSADECWPWVGRGTKQRSGHWRIWFQHRHWLAHRVSFLLAGGQINDGEVVMHAVCNLPSCQNYLHLRAGLPLWNSQQRDELGRLSRAIPRGQDHHSSRLSNREAELIRQARALGVPAKVLAALHEVSLTTIYNVWRGVHYDMALGNSIEIPPITPPALRLPMVATVSSSSRG